MAGVTVKLNTERLRRELAAFTRDLGPRAVDLAVRRTVFDVGGSIVRSIGGAGAGFVAPKRVDTGRYRAGWAMGVERATGRSPGATSGGHAGDGTAQAARTSSGTTIRVLNNVEYGPYIEDGTENMRPGHHVALSLLKATVTLREHLGKTIPEAWAGQLRGGV